MKTLVRDFDVVHFSVHGKFDAAEPMLSYLQFARGADDDGRLTAAEMFGLPLERSRIVVLSACETGRAQATQANEILGMVRALIYAGAGTLVLSVLGGGFRRHRALDAGLLRGGAHAATRRRRAYGAAQGQEHAQLSSSVLLGSFWHDRSINKEMTDFLQDLGTRVKALSGDWATYMVLGNVLLYVVGYLTLRFHLTAMGISTDLAVVDERYWFTGARFIVYLVAAVPSILLLGLPVAAVGWGAAKLFGIDVVLKPRPMALFGIIFAVIMIQFVMRQCFFFSNLLLARNLPAEPAWLVTLLLDDQLMPCTSAGSSRRAPSPSLSLSGSERTAPRPSRQS